MRLFAQGGLLAFIVDLHSERTSISVTTPSSTPTTKKRSLVFVAGSGRSGTSLMAGTLQRLGVDVPQPEVPPDDSNPRGFAESQWIVNFHTRLLAQTGVQTADARPGAWALTAAVAAKRGEIQRARAFLAEQFADSDHIVIKDPRLSWFMPLWRRVADEFGVQPCFITMLRHPAAVVDSKSRYYGNWQGDVGRAAGWLNGMLFTERATRESPRIFVRYEDLLDDWTEVLARVGEACDLEPVRNASAPALRRVHQFIDPSLSRSSASWDGIPMPADLRDQCEHVWSLLNSLADPDSDGEKVRTELDEARAAYLELYEYAEAIAQSSVVARRRPTKRRSASLTGWIPKRYRRRVPVYWRRRVLSVFGQAGDQAT
jgi:hypothetical protein